MKIENNKRYYSVKIDKDGNLMINSELKYSHNPYAFDLKYGISQITTSNIIFQDNKVHEIYIAVHDKYIDNHLAYTIVDIGFPRGMGLNKKTFEILDNFLHGKEYSDGEFVTIPHNKRRYFEEHKINFVDPVSKFVNELSNLAEESKLKYIGNSHLKVIKK